MKHRIVLNIAVMSHDNPIDIPAKDRSIPDAAVVPSVTHSTTTAVERCKRPSQRRRLSGETFPAGIPMDPSGDCRVKGLAYQATEEGTSVGRD